MMSQGKRQNDSSKSYEPSLEEIRRECRKIQKGWDKNVERRRATGTKHVEPYTVPMVTFVRYRDGTLGMEEVG